MSFGYSVGDCFAGANLTYRLIKAMSETQGSTYEYQQAMTELSSLQQTFLLVSQMRPGPFLDISTINAASCIVVSSMELIGKFLDRFNAHRKRLSTGGSTSSISNSWRKIGWALFGEEELKQLRDVLHTKLSHVNLLLSAANFRGQGSIVDAGMTSKFQVPEQHMPVQHDQQISHVIHTKSDELPSNSDASSNHDTNINAHSTIPCPGSTQASTLDKDHSTNATSTSGTSEVFKEREIDLFIQRSHAIINDLVSLRTLLQGKPGHESKTEIEPHAAPLDFKDAVGRRFRFPWKLCRSWTGMEDLIRQAFLHVDIIGSHVDAGHYDLLGPESQIILPGVWDDIVQPGMSITMHMWPLPEQEEEAKDEVSEPATENQPKVKIEIDEQEEVARKEQEKKNREMYEQEREQRQQQTERHEPLQEPLASSAKSVERSSMGTEVAEIFDSHSKGKAVHCLLPESTNDSTRRETSVPMEIHLKSRQEIARTSLAREPISNRPSSHNTQSSSVAEESQASSLQEEDEETEEHTGETSISTYANSADGESSFVMISPKLHADLYGEASCETASDGDSTCWMGPLESPSNVQSSSQCSPTVLQAAPDISRQKPPTLDVCKYSESKERWRSRAMKSTQGRGSRTQTIIFKNVNLYRNNDKINLYARSSDRTWSRVEPRRDNNADNLPE